MFFLSWRQLITRKKQTIFIILGIALGTLLFVSISSVQLGMREYILHQLLNHTSHIIISGDDRKINARDVTKRLYPSAEEFVIWSRPPSGMRDKINLENYSGWFHLLSEDPRVIDFSPRLNAHVVLNQGDFSSSVNLIGVLPSKTVKITDVEDYMIEGHFLNLKGSHSIVIGQGVAEDLGITLGDIVSANAGTNQNESYKVVGVFKFGNEQVDKSLSFMNLKDLQVLSKSPGRVTEISVALFDMEKAQNVASEWKLLTRDKVQDWQEANQSFMEMIKVQDFTRYFITLSVLIVASFGIYNVLTIMINQKKKEIAILRAIGFGPRKILQLILNQGLFLGFVGGVLGLLGGHLMNIYIAHINLNIEIGNSNHLPVSFEPQVYFLAFVSALISSLISSIIPAKEASRMSPMDSIRSE